MLNCTFCNYSSNRKFCIKRHEINKHSKEILQENNKIIQDIKIKEEEIKEQERLIYNCYKCNK